MHPFTIAKTIAESTNPVCRINMIARSEHEILHHIAHAHSSKDIESKLYVSYETVSSHRKNIMNKLGAKNTTGVVRMAFERGLMRVGHMAFMALILFGTIASSYGQQLTGLEYNYEVHSIGGWMNYNEGGSEEEVTWLTAACHDGDDVATFVIPDYTNVGTSECGGQIRCNILDADCDGGCPAYWDERLLVVEGESDTQFDLTFRSWEDDGDRCVEDDDDNRGASRRLRDARSYVSEPGRWSPSYTISNSINNSDVKFKAVWRYTKGRKTGSSFAGTGPIDFGVINGSKYHINSNREAPQGVSSVATNTLSADTDMGYSNDWSGGVGHPTNPDVTYTFTIADEAKNVTISTNYSGNTDFDTHLFLYDGSTLLDDHDDIAGINNRRSIITRTLCPGTYTVVVDGYAQGDFRLNISSSAYSFSAGTLSSSTGQTVACSTAVIQTINGTVVPDLFDEEPSYQWKVWDEDNSQYVNVTSGSATFQNLSNYGKMVDETLYFIREATICGVTKTTSYYQITYQPSTIDPGIIFYKGPGSPIPRLDNIPPIRAGYNASDFFSSNDEDIGDSEPSADPLPLSYRWEQSTSNSSNDDDWSDAGGTDLFYSVPALNETTYFRRIAINGCGVGAPSNSLKITILPANGVISGKVTAPPIGIGTGINDVMVCASPANALDGAAEECVLTSGSGMNSGSYTIENLYFGPDELDYIVSATLVDHDIIVPQDPNNPSDNDSTITVPLTQQNPTATAINFIDTTVYTLDGNVYQTFVNTDYGKMDVLIKLINSNGITEDTIRTDKDGNYSMIVPNAGVYTIKPELKTEAGVVPSAEHTFLPADRTITILGNTDGVNFEDITKSQLISILDGPCDLKIGSVEFKLIDEETENGSTSGINIDFAISKATAMRDLFVPARNYKVDVLEDTFAEVSPGINAADVKAQYTDIPPYETDLTFRDTSIAIIYKAPPQIEFEGIPELLSCPNGSSFDYPILLQKEAYPDFKIKVWEGPVANGCPQDTGFVKLINNGIENPRSFPISSGEVQDFLLVGGNPNIIAPYTQAVSIKAQSLEANNPKTRDTTFIVSGALARGKTFFTQSPETPLLILRDPPTDLGYAWYEETNSLAYRFKTQAKRSNINNSWGTLKVGADVSISNGIGAEVGYNIAGWINGTDGSNGTTSTTSSTETDMTVSLNQRYQTDDVLIGAEGDLYVTGVLNFVYSKTDELLIDSNLCVAYTDTSVMIFPDSISSIAALTNSAVNNRITILEDLKANDNNSNDPKGAIFYDTQIQNFRDMQARNEDLKKRAIQKGKDNTETFDPDNGQFTGNIDYSGGSVFERDVTYDTLRSFMHEFLVEVENFEDVNGGFEVMGNGLSGGNYIALRTEVTPIDPNDAHKNTDTLNQVTINTGFHLEDNEANDNFLIGVHKDETYGTPVFDLIAANTSCPFVAWDPQDPRGKTDPFEVVPDPAFPVQRVGIDPATGVQYKFTIRNSGLFKAGYLVEPDLAYNENGAIITVNGSNTNGIVIDSLNPGDSITVGFTVKHDPAVQIFNHTIKMNIYAYCSYNFQPIRDNTNKKTLDFSVTFTSDCSRIDIIDPSPFQIVNTENQGKLKIQLRNYDKSKMDRFFLQYKKTGQQQWTSSTTFDYSVTKLFDDAAGTIIDWILPPDLADGATDIRITTTCTGGLASGSEIVPILVDLTKPEVFGLPSPIDDNYSLEEDDQLSVSYTEDIMDDGSIVATIVDLINGTTITPVQVDIFENQIIITPQQDLGSLPASLYRVSLTGVKDLNGNKADPYGWVFAVGNFDFGLAVCLENLVVSNNNFNQNSITATNYNALKIISDGIISSSTTPVMYNAQESVDFEAGFTVNSNAIFEANIKDCLD